MSCYKGGHRMNDAPAKQVTISIEEISKIIGLSSQSVWGALRRGELPGHKISGRWIISRKAFFKWLDGEK